jgi:hypothetical protein
MLRTLQTPPEPASAALKTNLVYVKNTGQWRKGQNAANADFAPASIHQPSKDMDDDSPQRHAAGKRRADRIVSAATRDLIIASIAVTLLVTLMMLA